MILSSPQLGSTLSVILQFRVILRHYVKPSALVKTIKQILLTFTITVEVSMNGPTNKYSERGSLKIFIMLTEELIIFPSYSVFVVQLLNSYSDRFSIKRNWKAPLVMTTPSVP